MSILPDVLQPNLKVVFCGTAAGTKSAQTSAYYAGRGNVFWDVLHRIGLTSRRLSPQEFTSLPDYGIGLTDLVKHHSGSDASLRSDYFDVGDFRNRILKYAPRAIAFNGKKVAQVFYGRSDVSYGRQPETLGTSAIFILPSTSGAARGAWDETYWRDLAAFLKG